MAQESGEVEGTEVIINAQRTYTWDAAAAANDFAKGLWKSIRTANLSVSKSYEISGVVGTLGDLVAHAELLDGLNDRSIIVASKK